MLKLLSTGNPKTLKGVKQGFHTYMLHLAPSNVSGHNVCPKATAGCIAACLNTAGRGGMFKLGETTNVIQKARIRKTLMFVNNRVEFLDLLVTDITKAIRQSKRLGLTPVFRLNGTSDLSWEKYKIAGKTIFELFPDVQFYDYTKVLNRKVTDIPNYHLTFSKADGNDLDVKKAIKQGLNVAVVFATKVLPVSYLGLTVFNGDDSDIRFRDPKNSIVGLYLKGKAANKKIALASGFAVQI
jgi:hypothetical protein